MNMSQVQVERVQVPNAIDREALRQQVRQTVEQAVREGRGGTTEPPRIIVTGNSIPPQAEGIAYMFFITVAAVLILRPLMGAFARRLERRPMPAQALPPEAAQQLARIEQTVEAMAIEVERISEGQRFAARLLSERERLPS